MWSLVPVHTPRIGVSLQAQRLDLVEVRHRWGRLPVVRRLVSRPLPPGLIAPSCTTPNVLDPEATVSELRALCEGLRDRIVAVDLPMAAGTLALFHFETFPPSHAEQEALIRWRFRQDEHVAANDLRVVSQVFSARSEGKAIAPVSVLAVAMRESLLAQYHRLFDDAGLLPVSMGFSALHLLELYRRVLPARAEVLFAHRTAEALVVLAFQRGCPVMVRVKPLRCATVELKAELLRTLQFYDSQFPHRASTSGAEHALLYVLDEGKGSLPEGDPPATEVWTPTDNPGWTVEMTPVTWAMAPMVSALAVPDVPPFGALAGVLAS